MTDATTDQDDFTEAVKKLYVRLLDAANGYEEAAEKTDESEMTTLYADMARFRNEQATALAPILTRHGADPDGEGSWISVLQRTIMQVRGVLGALGREALDPIVSGERRLLELYDETIAAGADGEDVVVLTEGREATAKRIAGLETMRGEH